MTTLPTWAVMVIGGAICFVVMAAIVLLWWALTETRR